ncbi:hypothetical protein ACFQGT_02765 [Natrialbaceae archaeon GCM10025810]|uniref:hypothetical protein n=1 Tax=Halovalidus salilacus TaxID=3075124 RepID=UPI00361EACAC
MRDSHRRRRSKPPPGERSAARRSDPAESTGSTEDDPVRRDVVDRLEGYFALAADGPPAHGALVGDAAVYDGEGAPSAFDDDSLEAWHRAMDAEEVWLCEHRRAVEGALSVLEDEWPRSVAAVREHVL